MTIIEALIKLRNDIKTWVANNLRTKVDKVDGKGLSTNDFDNDYKDKLTNAASEDFVRELLDNLIYVDETNNILIFRLPTRVPDDTIGDPDTDY